MPRKDQGAADCIGLEAEGRNLLPEAKRPLVSIRKAWSPGGCGFVHPFRFAAMGGLSKRRRVLPRLMGDTFACFHKEIYILLGLCFCGFDHDCTIDHQREIDGRGVEAVDGARRGWELE